MFAFLLVSQYLLVQVFAGCPDPLDVEANKYYKQAVKTCNATVPFSRITGANEHELCTPGCKQALETIKLDYSSCKPSIKPCSATKGIKKCSVNVAGVLELKCPADSKCSINKDNTPVFPPVILSTGDCSCTSSSKPCWDSNKCEENPDLKNYQSKLDKINKALSYAALDAECSANQIHCCPGKLEDDCDQKWCDQLFTPACMPKGDFCYSQVGLAVGLPIVVCIVVGIIIAIACVLHKQETSKWGRAGAMTDVNNPARFM